MAALCQAMETKDLYTRGHTEWVSPGVVMTGREIGMRASRVEAIRYARMLHDVASSGVPTTVLRKQGRASGAATSPRPKRAPRLLGPAAGPRGHGRRSGNPGCPGGDGRSGCREPADTAPEQPGRVP